MNIIFPYKEFAPVEVPDESLIAVLTPKMQRERSLPDAELIRDGLRQPIGCPPLKELVRNGQQILVLVDDYTRNTPTHLILPSLMEELGDAGIAAKDIRLLVASGTHRAMTREEKIQKYGRRIVEQYEVLDHLWDSPDQLTQLPTTEQGTEIWVNTQLLAADFVIGIGHIVPHRIPGFSGGTKIVQPGVCGAVTTGQTHWLSACYDGAEILGKRDNPIRREMDEVGIRAGLKFIINPVQDGAGNLVKCFCGDPVQAFRAGCELARDIYGAPLTEPADIVIAESFPADVDLWQAAKGVFSADIALKTGGVLILVTPCPEGVSEEHPEIVDIGYQSVATIEAMVQRGEIEDLTLAAHIAHIGRVICDKGTGILVSTGIDRHTAGKLGFQWAETAQAALKLAFELQGADARIAVLKNGGEVMPVLIP